jgi:hypothetical protein
MGLGGQLRVDLSSGGWREDRRHEGRTKSRAPEGLTADRHQEARRCPQARSVRSEQSQQPAIGLAGSSRYASAVLSDQSNLSSILAVVALASENATWPRFG